MHTLHIHTYINAYIHTYTHWPNAPKLKLQLWMPHPIVTPHASTMAFCALLPFSFHFKPETMSLSGLERWSPPRCGLIKDANTGKRAGRVSGAAAFSFLVYWTLMWSIFKR